MSKVVKVRNVTLGEGIPKICVPIVEEDRKAILKEAADIIDMPIDMIEWRVDWYNNSENITDVKETILMLRKIVNDIPILFTFRTKNEGGNKDISKEQYILLNQAAIDTGAVDLIDIELFMVDELVKNLISYAKEKNCKILASNHDFHNTPSKEEILSRLLKMQDLGADVPKIAVMPNEVKDVLVLLDATREMNQLYAKGPFITMSMAGTGLISRLSGELFGSALTFASAKKKSAPGQIPVHDLRTILNIYHDNLV